MRSLRELNKYRYFGCRSFEMFNFCICREKFGAYNKNMDFEYPQDCQIPLGFSLFIYETGYILSLGTFVKIKRKIQENNMEIVSAIKHEIVC